jgi:hypothetical protein
VVLPDCRGPASDQVSKFLAEFHDFQAILYKRVKNKKGIDFENYYS